jgi:hypothetical protein
LTTARRWRLWRLDKRGEALEVDTLERATVRIGGGERAGRAPHRAPQVGKVNGGWVRITLIHCLGLCEACEAPGLEELRDDGCLTVDERRLPGRWSDA